MQIKKVKLISVRNSQVLTIASGPIIITNNKVLLVRTIGSNKFKFPGGTLNDDESFIDTLKREAKEEINCVVEPFGDPIFYYIHNESNHSHIVLVHYLAKIIKGEPMPSSEVEEIRWFDIKDLHGDFEENVLSVIQQISLITA